jgi:hypothetical protein
MPWKWMKGQGVQLQGEINTQNCQWCLDVGLTRCQMVGHNGMGGGDIGRIVERGTRWIYLHQVTIDQQ